MKKYSSYAPDMVFQEARSKVNVKVKVTQKRYVTLRHPTIHTQAKFGICIWRNAAVMLKTLFFRKQGQR